MDIDTVMIPMTTTTLLGEIMERHGSDKGNSTNSGYWHNYTNLYFTLFNPVRNESLRVFELGLGPRPNDGASLRGWAEFFPNAQIFGADIDRTILFQEGSIKTYFCDQTDSNIIKEMYDHPDLSENFDIIIEDGLHSYQSQVCFLENSLHKLKVGGIYVIEDVTNASLHQFIQAIESWKIIFSNYTFKIVCIPNEINNYDNNVILVQRKA